MSKSNSDYNDRGLADGADSEALPKPQIEIIVDGNKVFKPGMKTFFVDEFNKKDGSFDTQVMGEYCSCDTVTTTYTVCVCEDVCSCNSYHKTVTTPTTPSIPCPADLANSVPNSTQVCSCQSVSCGSPCACVPVH